MSHSTGSAATPAGSARTSRPWADTRYRAAGTHAGRRFNPQSASDNGSCVNQTGEEVPIMERLSRPVRPRQG